MFRYLLTAAICLVMMSAQAQRDYFIYLQTQDQQPFYIVFGGNNYSSSSAGHLILPRLSEGAYPLSIGFPGKEGVTPFEVKVEGKDAGYLVTENEGSYQLKNLLSNTIIAQKREAPPATPEVIVKKETEIVTVSDTLPEKPAVAVIQDDIKPVEPEQSSKTVEQENVDSKILVQDKATALEARLKALQEQENKMLQAYKTGGAPPANATVKHPANDGVIYADTGSVKPKQTRKPVENTAAETSVIVISPDPVQIKPGAEKNKTALGERKFLDIEMGVDTTQLVKPIMGSDSLKTSPVASEEFVIVADTSSSPKKKPEAKQADNQHPTEVVTVPSVTIAETTVVVNSEPGKLQRKPCNEIAKGDEVDVLVKQLEQSSDEDELVYEARKAFKSKCVTTYQVKEICKLAKSDQVVYRLLDAAWPYTADYFNFRELRSLLKAEYYLSRFDAMIQ